MSESWVIADLLPHDGNMVLLDELVEQRESGVTARLQVRQDGLFDRDGQVPSWVGIEYMAQAIALYAGLKAKQAGEPIKLGFLLGTRRYQASCKGFICGSSLQVMVDEALQGSGGLRVFECTMTGDNVLVTANLQVFQPADVETFLNEGKL